MTQAVNLFHAIHGRGERVRPSHVRIAAPVRLTGMGVLESLEVRTADGLETWTFTTPKPRLGFTRLVDCASCGRSALWILGGSYAVDGHGFHNTRGRSNLVRLPLDATRRRMAGTVDAYGRTHGRREPHEAMQAEFPRRWGTMVNVGRLHAVTYYTDKREDGPANYRHEFAQHAGPTVMVTASGRQLVLTGGNYTVTPHGIEDAS